MIKEQFKQNKDSWINSFKSGFCLDKNNNAIPWMTYPAISYLERFVTKKQEVFEFGLGSSTLFFARNCQNVYSIETNKIWSQIITTKLEQQNLENSNITLMEDGLENENYENYLKTLNKKFDIIIIDSIKRYKSAINSINYLKDNGIIILDDSQRKNYQKIFDFFANNNFKKQDFPGIEPGKLKMKNTTIFSMANN